MGLLRSVIADARSAPSTQTSGDKLSTHASNKIHGSVEVGHSIYAANKIFGTVSNYPNNMNEPGQSSSSIGNHFASSESFRDGEAGSLATNTLGVNHTRSVKGEDRVSHEPSSGSANKFDPGGETTVAPDAVYRSEMESLQEPLATIPSARLSEQNNLSSIPDSQSETSESDLSLNLNLDISTHEQDSTAGIISDSDVNSLIESKAKSGGTFEAWSSILAESEQRGGSPPSENQNQFPSEADKSNSTGSSEEGFSIRSDERTPNALLTPITKDDLHKKESYRDAAINSDQAVDKSKNSQPKNFIHTDKEWQFAALSSQSSASQEPAENTAPGVGQPVATRPGSQPGQINLNKNAHQDNKSSSDRGTHILDEVPDRDFVSRASTFKIDAEKVPDQIRTQAQSVAAQMLSNKHISRLADRPVTKPASTDIARAPEVKIGQVDVFVEAVRRPHTRGASPARPSPLLASRHYLRRP